jgi:hypothetical protein
MGDSSKLSLIKLTFLILQLNKLIDKEAHKGITQLVVKDQIRKGDVFRWLRTKFGNDIDLSKASQIVSGMTKDCRNVGWVSAAIGFDTLHN